MQHIQFVEDDNGDFVTVTMTGPEQQDEQPAVVLALVPVSGSIVGQPLVCIGPTQRLGRSDGRADPDDRLRMAPPTRVVS